MTKKLFLKRPLALTPLLLLIALLGLKAVLSMGDIAGFALANAGNVILIKHIVGGQGLRPYSYYALAQHLSPGNLHVLRGEWRALAYDSRLDEAENVMRQLLEQAPQGDAPASLALGLLQIQRGNETGALAIWEALGPEAGTLAVSLNQAIKNGSGFVSTPLLPGQSVNLHPRLVCRLAETGIQAGNIDVWLYVMIGDYYRFQENNSEQAIAWYLAGRQVHPDSFIPPAYAAGMLGDQGRCDEALPLFQEAYRKSPWPRPDYWAAAGRCYLVTGQPTLAVEWLAKAVKLVPDNPEWNQWLAQAYITLDSK